MINQSKDSKFLANIGTTFALTGEQNFLREAWSKRKSYLEVLI